jgi:hypothetical protein
MEIGTAIKALREVKIRPRVAGLILDRHLQQGSAQN